MPLWALTSDSDRCMQKSRCKDNKLTVTDACIKACKIIKYKVRYEGGVAPPHDAYKELTCRWQLQRKNAKEALRRVASGSSTHLGVHKVSCSEVHSRVKTGAKRRRLRWFACHQPSFAVALPEPRCTMRSCMRCTQRGQRRKGDV